MSTASSIEKIIKRDGTTVPYDRERVESAVMKAAMASGVHKRAFAANVAQSVENALVSTYGDAQTPSVEDIQDVVESVMMESGHTKIARSFIIYRHQRAMARAAKAYSFEVSDHVPYKKIYEVLRWNIDNHCDSISAINELIASGGFPELVRKADERYSEEAALGAAKMLERLDQIRIAIVAGPSSSGKTTTTIRVSEKLTKAGVGFKAINIDHYFFDLEAHPKDEFGDYDYETPEALDLELINEHLVQLLEGRTIKTPHYDFKSGKRELNAHEFRLEKNEILLIDSLHGLYDKMTHSIPAELKFKLYIETLGQVKGTDGSLMRWSDNRLLRRMIRDMHHRNQQPMETLTHWHYVRRSELTNIIPFIDRVDYIVNSAMPYELPILKNLLFDLVQSATDTYRDDPKRLDAHIRANRVHNFLAPLTPVEDFSCVPDNSLVREFVGGSRYTY